MKRLTLYFALLSLIFGACNPVQPVPKDHLSILSGVVNNQLLFDGTAGAETTCTISSKLAWEILDTPGVTYNPSSGEATESVTITATVHEANRTLESRELGDVTIRLARTRFTGITAHQRPLVTLEQQEVVVAAQQNLYEEFTFECKEAVEVIPSGDIVCTASKPLSSSKYNVTVAATKDNLTAETKTIGYLTFKVDGTTLDGKVAVNQLPAISFDRSRVTVGGNEGEQMSFAVDTPFDFTVTSTTPAITVVRGAESKVDITVVEPNSGSEERKLGTMTIALADNPACKASIDVWQRKSKADKAMFFYYLGTSLRGYYDNNMKMVEKIVKSGAMDDCRVLAFIQSSQNSGKLLELFYDKEFDTVIREQIATYDLPLLYSQRMISRILKDMATRAPAVECGLFIGSHGKGWLPKNSSSSARTTFSTVAADDIWTPAPGAIMVRHIGDSANSQLDTTELAGAIQSMGCELSYIVFDACYMANVESAYDLKDCADYILASPCEIIASGMPYEKILPVMLGEESVEDRLNSVGKIFVDHYTSGNNSIYDSACSAVIHCNELEALAVATKRVNGFLRDIDPDSVQVYDGVSASRNPTHIFFDIEDYVLKSCTDTDATTAFTEQLARTVTGQYHTKTFYSAYNNKANPIDYYSGLTTSAPILLNSASAYIEDWKGTAWYKATH